MDEYVMKADVVIPASDPFEYITFVKDGQELNDCSTQNGQIGGTGVTGDPYSITINIDPNTPDVGSVDCGFVRVSCLYEQTPLMYRASPGTHITKKNCHRTTEKGFLVAL